MKASSLLLMASHEWNHEKDLIMEVNGKQYIVTSVGGNKDSIIIKTRENVPDSLLYKSIQEDFNNLGLGKTLRAKGVSSSRDMEIYRKAIRACKSIVSKYNPDKKSVSTEGGDK